MAIVRYCIINTGAPIGRCTAVISWDDANTYYPESGSVVAGDNTGEVDQTYSSGSSPGGIWFPAAAPSYTPASGGGALLIEDGGTGASDAATARTNLGVAIGTNVQAYDATLQSLSALGTAADKYAYTTGVDTWVEGSITAAGRAILDDADASAQRTTLDVPAKADIVGQQTIWVPAGAMVPQVTNGPARATEELATNDVMINYLAFDTSVLESAQVQIQMPKSWNEGTIIAQFVWKHPATTVNFGVVWGLKAVGFANDDAMDIAFGVASEVTDTGGTTADCYITPETTGVTVAGTPTSEELVSFLVYRNTGAAGDTMAVDAHLIGVKLKYTTDAARDN